MRSPHLLRHKFTFFSILYQHFMLRESQENQLGEPETLYEGYKLSHYLSKEEKGTLIQYFKKRQQELGSIHADTLARPDTRSRRRQSYFPENEKYRHIIDAIEYEGRLDLARDELLSTLEDQTSVYTLIRGLPIGSNMAICIRKRNSLHLIGNTIATLRIIDPFSAYGYLEKMNESRQVERTGFLHHYIGPIISNHHHGQRK